MKTYLITILTISALLAMSTAGSAQLVTPSPDLPPDGDYVSPDEYHTYLAMGIVLDDPSHDRFLNVVRTPLGPDELESFDSDFSAVEVGMGLGPMMLTGPVQVITSGKVGNTTGTFDTEIIAMSLTSNTPLGVITVRQDPNRATLGQTTITDIGGGLYQIDSFFDVFTELSVDGGASWIPSDTSTHMRLTPEPATLALMLMGAVALLRGRR